jgi:hypothetical protein
MVVLLSAAVLGVAFPLEHPVRAFDGTTGIITISRQL